MSIHIKFVFVGGFLLLAAVSFASSQNQVLQVPAQFKTIQAAIDAAQNTDTVLVAPGTYQENIDADPLFVDKTDYHLQYGSPCRNKGTNQAPGLGQMDFEGDPRVSDGNADMGADEFFPHLYHVGDVRVGSGHGFHVIGNPGTPTFWGVSMTILDPPCSLPGLGGQLYLEQSRLAVIPVDMLPPTGHLFIPFALPQTFPEMKVPTQALIGLVLSNLDVVTVYK